MAPEIADQREVRVIGQRSGQREVVMDSRDRLHAPAVAMRKTHAVDALGAADVGRAVAADRDGIVRRKSAWHARAPEQLVADRAIDHLVNLGQLVEASLRAAMHAGDELELRLAEVGGDARMGERRAELRRMARGRQHAVGPHPQSLLFDSAAQARQHGRRERVQPREATGGGGGGHRIFGETRLAHLTTRPRVRNACVALANERAAAPFRAWRLCVGSRRTSQQTRAQCLSEGLRAPDEIPNRGQLRRGGPAGGSPEGLAGLHDPPPAPARGRRARVVLPLPAARHVRHRPAAWRSGGSNTSCGILVGTLAGDRLFGCRCSGALDSRSRALLPTRSKSTATPLQGPCARAHTGEGCCKSSTWTLRWSGRPDLRFRSAQWRLPSPSTGYGAPHGGVTRGAGSGRVRRGFAGSRQRRPGKRHRQEPEHAVRAPHASSDSPGEPTVPRPSRGCTRSASRRYRQPVEPADALADSAQTEERQQSDDNADDADNTVHAQFLPESTGAMCARNTGHVPQGQLRQPADRGCWNPAGAP